MVPIKYINVLSRNLRGNQIHFVRYYRPNLNPGLIIFPRRARFDRRCVLIRPRLQSTLPEIGVIDVAAVERSVLQAGRGHLQPFLDGRRVGQGRGTGAPVVNLEMLVEILHLFLLVRPHT